MANQPLSSSLTLPAPAKLNLFLHITGRRADGYHLLQTLFVFLDYADTIHLVRRSDHAILRCQGDPSIPEDEDLTLRAAHLLQKVSGVRVGVDLYLDKRLPMGGGLGGGSSDAATVLLGLNRLWGCGLSLSQLAELGVSLGADVPVFVHGHAAWAEGVGELLTPVDVPEKWYLVVHPNVHVKTAELFQHEGLTRNCEIIKIAHFLAGQTRNVFEPVVKKTYPEVAEAFDWTSGFAQAKLTGSGACLFAAFDDEIEAQRILAKLPEQWFGFVAKACNRSPLHAKLKL